jgi:hypothetical protein
MIKITVTARSASNEKFLFDINDTISLNEFVVLLKEKASLTDEHIVRLITKGRQMTDDDMTNDFKQFKGIDPHFVFMSKISKPVVTQSIKSDDTETTKLTYLTPPSEVDMTLKFDTRQVHMYTLKLLNYIATNPTLRNLCMANPDALLTVFEKSSNMKLIYQMLKQSQSSLDDLDNGSSNGTVVNLVHVTDDVSASDIEVTNETGEINDNEDSIDSLDSTNSQLYRGTMEEQILNQLSTMLNGSGFTTTYMTSVLAPMTTVLAPMTSVLAPMTTELAPMTTELAPILSDDDRVNIKKIVDMGFSESSAEHAYIISGKNVDHALNILLSI